MLGWSKTVTMGLRLFIRPSNVMRFSQNNWRDRDEAAEKVYISQQEAASLKKLLAKVEHEELQQLGKNTQFERSLKDIMARHKVGNEAFFCQVSNIHKMMAKQYSNDGRKMPK